MGNVHMEATQINYRGGSKKMSVEEAIKAAGTEITPEEKTWIDSIPALTTSNAGKTDQDVIAPEFDAEAGVYAVGDKVMYEGKLYEFTSAHETPGDWDSTEVSETTVGDELSSLESGLIDRAHIYAGLLRGNATLYIGHNNCTALVYTDRGGMWFDGFVGRDFTTIASSQSITASREDNFNVKLVSSVNNNTYVMVVSENNIEFGDTPFSYT